MDIPIAIQEREKIKEVLGSSDCWIIQMQGFQGCIGCDQRDGDECGGAQVLLYKIATEIGGTSMFANSLWQEAREKSDLALPALMRDMKANPDNYSSQLIGLMADQIGTAWRNYLLATDPEAQKAEWKELYSNGGLWDYDVLFYRYIDGVYQLIEITGTDSTHGCFDEIDDDVEELILTTEGSLDIDALISSKDGAISSCYHDPLGEADEAGYYTKENIKANPESSETLLLLEAVFSYGLGRGSGSSHKIVIIDEQPEDMDDEDWQDLEERLKVQQSHNDWFKDKYEFDPEKLTD